MPDRVRHLSGGYSNANYRVDFGSQSFVLRIFVGGEDVGEREVGVLRLAKHHSIRVPKVVDFKVIDGKAVATLEFVDGILLSRALHARPDDAGKIFHNVGRELAQVHARQFPAAGLFAKDA